MPTPVGDPLPGSTNQYSSFTFRGTVYKINGNVFLPSDAYNFPVRTKKGPKKSVKRPGWVESDPNDENKFPELYRKSEYIKGSNLDVPKPFQIGGLMFTCRPAMKKVT